MKRIITIVAITVASLGTVVGIGIPAAQAQSGYTWEDPSGYYLNDWNGGGYVNQYSGYSDNDLFTDVFHTSGTGMVFTGGGGNNGDCIGDYGSSKTDARAGIVYPCPGSSNPAWGSNLDELSCDNGTGLAFYDYHWGGYIAPSGAGNGDAFYLNGAETCFIFS
jgi:hypothetical protein